MAKSLEFSASTKEAELASGFRRSRRSVKFVEEPSVEDAVADSYGLDGIRNTIVAVKRLEQQQEQPLYPKRAVRNFQGSQLSSAVYLKLDAEAKVEFNIKTFATEFLYQTFFPLSIPLLLLLEGGPLALRNRMYYGKSSAITVTLQWVVSLSFLIMLATACFRPPPGKKNSDESLKWDILAMGMLWFVRNAVLAIKYAYTSAPEMTAMRTRLVPKTVHSDRTLFGGWVSPLPARVLKRQLLLSAIRNRLALSRAAFHLHPHRPGSSAAARADNVARMAASVLDDATDPIHAGDDGVADASGHYPAANMGHHVEPFKPAQLHGADASSGMDGRLPSFSSSLSLDSSEDPDHHPHGRLETSLSSTSLSDAANVSLSVLDFRAPYNASFSHGVGGVGASSRSLGSSSIGSGGSSGGGDFEGVISAAVDAAMTTMDEDVEVAELEGGGTLIDVGPVNLEPNPSGSFSPRLQRLHTLLSVMSPRGLAGGDGGKQRGYGDGNGQGHRSRGNSRPSSPAGGAAATAAGHTLAGGGMVVTSAGQVSAGGEGGELSMLEDGSSLVEDSWLASSLRSVAHLLGGRGHNNSQQELGRRQHRHPRIGKSSRDPLTKSKGTAVSNMAAAGDRGTSLSTAAAAGAVAGEGTRDGGGGEGGRGGGGGKGGGGGGGPGIAIGAGGSEASNNDPNVTGGSSAKAPMLVAPRKSAGLGFQSLRVSLRGVKEESSSGGSGDEGGGKGGADGGGDSLLSPRSQQWKKVRSWMDKGAPGRKSLRRFAEAVPHLPVRLYAAHMVKESCRRNRFPPWSLVHHHPVALSLTLGVVFAFVPTIVRAAAGYELFGGRGWVGVIAVISSIIIGAYSMFSCTVFLCVGVHDLSRRAFIAKELNHRLLESEFGEWNNDTEEDTAEEGGGGREQPGRREHPGYSRFAPGASMRDLSGSSSISSRGASTKDVGGSSINAASMEHLSSSSSGGTASIIKHSGDSTIAQAGVGGDALQAWTGIRSGSPAAQKGGNLPTGSLPAIGLPAGNVRKWPPGASFKTGGGSASISDVRGGGGAGINVGGSGGGGPDASDADLRIAVNFRMPESVVAWWTLRQLLGDFGRMYLSRLQQCALLYLVFVGLLLGFLGLQVRCDSTSSCTL
eukprot:jgi/Mesvir1/18740/Mv01249-RA.3